MRYTVDTQVKIDLHFDLSLLFIRVARMTEQESARKNHILRGQAVVKYPGFSENIFTEYFITFSRQFKLGIVK